MLALDLQLRLLAPVADEDWQAPAPAPVFELIVQRERQTAAAGAAVDSAIDASARNPWRPLSLFGVARFDYAG